MVVGDIMRVITGTARGIPLKTLDGNDIVRPTTDKVKEAVFSSIQFYLENCTFLDLFAGSGQVGIEALSRGALKAYFVDSNNKSISVVKSNLKATSLSDRAIIIKSDYKAFLQKQDIKDKVDIAFLDPPYADGLLEQALPMVADVMRKTGIMICESPLNESLPDQVGDFAIKNVKKYGKIKVTTYMCND